MKNISQALMLLALIGISFQSNSQVILNCGSFEPVFLTNLDLATGSIGYTVPAGKNLIITHLSSYYLMIDGDGFEAWDQSSDYHNVIKNVHIPVGANSTIKTSSSPDTVIGYLVDNDGFGVQIEDSEEEFTSEGGIEIYPNPTGDVASVFVDYQGTWDITVYNLNGQIVLESSVNTPVKTIDTNSLSSGTYIVSARAKRKLIGSSQLIVQ